MRDIGERPAVDQRGRPLERLDEVGLDRLREQHRHRAVGLKVLGGHRATIARIGDDDPPQPRFEIVEIGREAQDRHDFGRDGDVEPAFARISVRRAAERLRDVAQSAVVHVEHAPPHDPPHVDIERVAPMQMVVDHRCEQIVRRGDRVEIAGEMEVDVLHRHDLRIAAPGRTALGAETGSERGFAKRQHRLPPGPVERIGEANRGGRLAFARRGRVDRGDEDQFAGLRRRRKARQIDLRLVVAIGLDRLVGNARGGGDGADGLQGGGARDRDIGEHVRACSGTCFEGGGD
jgi:hypothetical protein